jgi:hypothetical protein
MKRFTSEELVLRFAAQSEGEYSDGEPDTKTTCKVCGKPSTCNPHKPRAEDEARASARELDALQHQLAGVLGS